MYNYWVGKDTDYDSVWSDFENGRQYEQKFRTMRVHLIRITLEKPARNLPLFNFEAVFKTIKGCYHDLKESNLTESEYNSTGPLFVYSVNRGSGIWSFLGELLPVLIFGAILTREVYKTKLTKENAALAKEDVISKWLENMDKKNEFLNKHFGGDISSEDAKRFRSASTPRKLQKALEKLVEQGIKSVQISGQPFDGDIEKTESSMIDIMELLDRADEDELD